MDQPYRSFVVYHDDISIILPAKQRERLKTTCFRDKGQPLAGNFYRWVNDRQFLGDPFISEELLADIREILRREKSPYATWSVEIECDDYVGWESTIRVKDINFALKLFGPNRWTNAWKAYDPNIRAPLTKIVTVIYSIEPSREERKTPAAVIHSIYPGKDVPLGSPKDPRTIDWHEAIFLDWNTIGSVDELKARSSSLPPLA